MTKIHTRETRKLGLSSHRSHKHVRRELNGHKTWKSVEKAQLWAKNNSIEKPTIVPKGKKFYILEKPREPYRSIATMYTK
jgi:hypothetical protein